MREIKSVDAIPWMPITRWFMLSFCSWCSVVIPKMWEGAATSANRAGLFGAFRDRLSVHCPDVIWLSEIPHGANFGFAFLCSNNIIVDEREWMRYTLATFELIKEVIIMSSRIIVSYAMTFLAGCVLGHVWNADELTTYRSLHESTLTRFRRHARSFSVGVVVMGSMWTILRVMSRPSPQKL